MSRIGEGLGIRRSIGVAVNEGNSGGSLNSPFFYRNPQYVVTAVPANLTATGQATLRVSYEGPEGSYILPILAKPDHKQRLVSTNEDVRVIKGKNGVTYNEKFACIEAKILLNTPYTLVLSNYEVSMLGSYKLTLESDVPLELQEILPEGHGLKQHNIEVVLRLMSRDRGTGRIAEAIRGRRVITRTLSTRSDSPTRPTS